MIFKALRAAVSVLHSLLWRFQQLGLQRRIMLYVSAGLVVLSVLFGIVALQGIQQSSELVFFERLIVARSIAHAVDDDLAQIQRQMAGTSITIAPALAANNLPQASNYLHDFHSQFTGSDSLPDSGTLFLTDPTGRVLWSEPERSDRIAANADSDSPLQVAFQHPADMMIQDLALDGSTRQTIDLVAPVRSRGQTIGLIVSQLDRQFLGQMLAPALDLNKSDYNVELIDDHGNVVSHVGQIRATSPSVHWPLVQPFMQAGQANVRVHNLQVRGEDRSHVIAFAPLTHLPWGVIVEQPTDQALILPRNLQTRFLVFGVVALLGGLGMAWLTTRSVVHPVNALIGASRRIADGDLDHALDISGQDEIGKLARAFDDMRVELRDSRQKIARWNKELEERVQERTRELTETANENARLYTALQEKEEVRAQLLQKVIEAQEEERKRIARDLHDEFAQTLTALTISLQSTLQNMPAGFEAMKQQLVDTQLLTGQTLQEISRWILELRPTVLDDLGLVPAIRWYAESRLESAHAGVEVQATGSKQRLPLGIETALFRIVQEAVNNIAKHAQARQVNIRLAIEETRITVEVQDDGIGFQADESLVLKDGLRGIGLLGMRERATLLGGTLNINSIVGSGTCVQVEVPWNR